MAISDLKHFGVKVRKHIPFESDEKWNGSYFVWHVDAPDEKDAKRKALLKFPTGYEAYEVYLYSDEPKFTVR